MFLIELRSVQREIPEKFKKPRALQSVLHCQLQAVHWFVVVLPAGLGLVAVQYLGFLLN